MADILFGNESILKNCQEAKPLESSDDGLLVEDVELLGYDDPLIQETLLVVEDEDDEDAPDLDEEEIEVYPLSDEADSDEAILDQEIEEEEQMMFPEKKSILPAHLNASLQNLERLGVFTRDTVNKDAPLSSQTSEDNINQQQTNIKDDQHFSKSPLILSPQKRTNSAAAKLIAPVPISIKVGAPSLLAHHQQPKIMPSSRGVSPPAALNFNNMSPNYYSTPSGMILATASSPVPSSRSSTSSSSYLRTSQGVSGLPNIMSSPSPVSLHPHHLPSSSYSPLASPFIYAPSPSLSPWYSPQQSSIFTNAQATTGLVPELNNNINNNNLRSSNQENTGLLPEVSSNNVSNSNNNSGASSAVHPFISRSQYFSIMQNKPKSSHPDFIAFFHSLFSGSSNATTYTPEMIDEIIQNNLHFSEISGKYFALEKIGEGTFSSVYKAKMVVDDSFYQKACLDTSRSSTLSSSSSTPQTTANPMHPSSNFLSDLLEHQQSDLPVPESEFWRNDEFLALKRIHPTCHPNRILNEIVHLKKLGGKSHVIPLISGLRDKDQVTLVFPFFNHDKFKETLPFLSLFEIQNYMKALFTSLSHVHSLKIIHRDIKPGNFLFQRKNEKFLLVDFGLAQIEENFESEKSILTKRNFSENSSEISSNFSSEQIQKKNKKIPENEPSFSLLNYSKNSSLFSSNNSLNNNNNTENSSKNSTPLNSSKNSNHHDDVITQKKILSFHSSNFFIQENVSKNQENVLKNQENVLKNQENVSSKNNVFEKNVSIEKNVSKNSFFLSKKSMQAARAGTRGFRAPEVLMKFKNQTTAIDVWSCGVIFLSILSQRYPFFHSPDDLTSLAEITALIGTKKMKETAEKIGKKFEFSANFPGENLKNLCQRLGKRENIPDSAYDLLEKLLDPNPLTRMTAEEALKHSFFQEKNENVSCQNFNFFGNVFY